MPKAALFDVDGTLVDSNDLHAQAWDETFRHFSVALAYARIRAQIGKGGDNLLPALLPPTLLARSQDAIETYRSDLFKRDYLDKVTAFPGVRPLFERLRDGGARIVLASSASAEEVEHHLDLLGVRDLVAAVTSADDVAHSKPCPDIFAAALVKMAPLGAADAIVVGDTPYDAAAAAKAGIRSLGVRCGGFDDAALRAAGVVAIYDDPADLLAHLETSPFGENAAAR